MSTQSLPRFSGKRSVLLSAVAIVWVSGVAVGSYKLLRYESKPGIQAKAPAMWPAASAIRRDSALPTILVFAHPRCPCTRATIGELSLLMTRLHSEAAATVIFVRPENVPPGWEKTDLWNSAAAIPGVSVISDPGERETDLFGAQASGQTLLYDKEGRLRFNGGITAARGHSGDNAGRSSIVALVTGEGPADEQTSVFGCDLRTPTSTDNRE